MNNTLRKWLPLLGIFSGAVAFAASNADNSYDSSMMSHDQQQNSNKSQVYKQITPPAGPNVENGVGFSIYADYILWEARAGGTAFALSGVGLSENTVLAKGQAYNPGFKYDSGFKVGASAMLGHDDWDVDARYTWLHSTGKKTELTNKTTDTTTYSPIFMSAPTNDVLTDADGQYSLRFNVVQLNLGRNYLISENLSLRPFAGLVGGWTRQTNNVNYTFTDSTTQVVSAYNIYQKQNWWGIGFQAGVEAGFSFDENWSIYANLGTDLFWGKYTNLNKERNVSDPNLALYAQNWEGTQYGAQPVIDLEMGFRWQMSFDDNTYAFLIQAGWEQQVWINNVRFGNAGNSEADLSLQGFNIRARFFF